MGAAHNSRNDRPPLLARLLLALLRREEREAVSGDLLEEFRAVAGATSCSGYKA